MHPIIEKKIKKRKEINKEEKQERKKEEKTIKCDNCDNLISRGATRCINCSILHKFQEASKDRPSYEQLKKDIKELKYYTTIAKKYDVSDNCIRKWLKKYEKYS